MDHNLIHVTIVLYYCLCLVMLNQGVLEVHKQFSRNSQNQFNSKFYLIQRNFQLVGCSDTVSKLPIQSEVLCYFRPNPLGQTLSFHRNFRYCIGTSDPPQKFPITSVQGYSGENFLNTSEVPTRHRNFRRGPIL